MYYEVVKWIKEINGHHVPNGAKENQWVKLRNKEIRFHFPTLSQHTDTNHNISAGTESRYSQVPRGPGGENKILSLGTCHPGV